MGKILGVALAGWVLLSCQAGSAVTWYVDGSVPESGEGQSWDTAFKTIQEAINTSDNGDTIIVARGTYVENILFKGKNVVLRSTNPLDPDTVASTIIDGDGAGSVVTFSGEEDESCILSGFTIQNGEFYSGGGIRGNSTRATISHNLITQNTAGSSYASYTYGGGVSWCNGIIFRNTITGNTATGKTSFGGGLYACNGSIRENVISHNSATGSTEGNGAGLGSCSGTIQNNRITDNSAGTKGGGLYQCHGTVQNNLIATNSAGEGAGLFDCDGDLQNNTIFGNAASSSGGGLAYCHGALRNCVIWGNTATTSGAQLHESNNPAFCCIQEWAGEGLNNVSDDPRLMDPEAGDYRLQEVSPCLDAGVDYYWFVWPQLDLDGNCRLAADHVDIGCYEYGSSPDADGDLLSEDGEGQVGTDPEHEDTDGDGLPDGLEILRGSNPREPTQPGMPDVPSELPTIQAALCLGVNGDEIVIAPGTYRENLRFCGTNVILRGSAPTDADTVALTVIDGSAGGPVIRLTGAETKACVISGLTIRNGRARAGGGICGGNSDSHTHATIRENAICGNVAAGDYAAGGGQAYCDGIIQNNFINDNSASGEHAYGGGLAYCHGTIQNNTISMNTCSGTYRYGAGMYACDGTIQSNLIVANSTTGYGGGLSSCDGLLINNSVVANTAHTGGGLNYCRGMILNCIVWGNTATDSGTQIAECNSPKHSCIQDGMGEGIGNISDDPLFMSATGGDYHLLSESPCINAGVNYYWVAWPQHDMDGMCRLAGDQVDMGCYEYGAFPDTDGDLLADAAESAAQTDVSDPDTDGDGLRDGVEMLAGTDPLVANSPRTIRVPADVPTIQQALLLARKGDEIVVAPGTYRENVAFCGAQVVLRSTNPQEPDLVASTVVDGGGVAPVVSFRGDEDESCILSGFTLTGGSGDSGGGVAGHGTLATIRHNIIIGNSASGTGGGLSECHGTIEHNTISGNSARSRGGGLSDCDGIITGNTISENSAEYDGGGLALCDGTIRNNLIAGNLAEYSGGGGLARCNALIENNTIYANRVTEAGMDHGGGLYGCHGTIRNCIIWRSWPTDSARWDSFTVPSYSCIWSWNERGVGNITAVPHFVDPAGGDFHLQSWSPCVDAGDPASSFTNEPGPNGGRINMGAYGNTPEAASTSPDSDHDQLPDEWETEYFGDLAQGPEDDPDEDSVSNLDEYLLARNPALPPGPDAHWFVDASRPASGVGSSPQTAFKTIQEGIDAAFDREIVSVRPGIYVENIEFKGENIVLTSTDPLDPEVVASTIIDGSEGCTQPHEYAKPTVLFYGREDETCMLSGFTIRNGTATHGGGVCRRKYSYETHATIRNNVITGNTAVVRDYGSDGYGGGVSGCDGIIEDNIIIGNTAEYGGGGLSHCDGTIRNNIIEGNAGGSRGGGGLVYCAGLMQDNIITGNSSEESGGGLSRCNGEIRSNIITDNLAQYSGGGLHGCDGTIRNNTIAMNRAVQGGGLAYCDGAVTDCIIWRNQARLDPQVSEVPNISYSCVEAWFGGGEGILRYNPHFADPESGDYHLSSWSLCIDAGDPSWPFQNEPTPNGNRVNMGAYGNTVEAATGSPDTDGDGLPDGWEVQFLASLQYHANDDPDNDGILNLTDYRYGWNPAIASENLVENSTTGAWYQTIQCALLEAGEGHEIVVHAGTYFENIRFGGNNLILRSANPSEPAVVAQTIIDGGSAGPVVTFTGTESPSCVLSGFTIRNGRVDRGGGILGGPYTSHTQASIRNNLITQTFSEKTGGGLAHCDGTIENNTIILNQSESLAGALFYCRGIIQNNIISSNTAQGDGGALYFCHGSIRCNVITENTAGEDAGALEQCDGIIHNNIIAGNLCGNDGGGLHDCSGAIESCTIFGNCAGGSGGGVADCDGLILNCIFWENAATIAPQIYDSTEPHYSCIEGWGEGGEGNLSRHPHFVDAQSDDFHLRSWSPCVDAGDPSSDFVNELGPNGGRINIGAYGNTTEAASGSLDADADGLPDNWELYWFADVQHDTHSDPDQDGIPNETEYLYAWNPTTSAERVVRNLAKERWYEAVQPALWECEDGDEIVVHPGVYRENIRFEGKNIVLRSRDPSDETLVASTIIDGGGKAPTVTFSGAESAACVLSGFTVRNGRGGIRGGSYPNYSQTTIESNIITQNSGGRDGGGIAYCGGMIQDNVISENSAEEDGGALFACHGTISNNALLGNSVGRQGGALAYCSGDILDNVICGNYAGGASGGLYECNGLIRNNLISQNHAAWRGGGLADCDGTILNNRISDNSAAWGGGLSFCKGTIQNNVISGSSADGSGGGLQHCEGVIQNNTVTGNSAGEEGGGLDYCKGTIVNCIIWGNTAPNGPQLYDSIDPSYSCIQDWAGGGEGNITDDPQLFDSENGDFRLAPSSPCIDAGDNNAPDLPETDFRGMHRIIYGGKSLTVDMGAYEYYVNEISLGESGEVTLTWSSLVGTFYSVYRSADMLTWEFAGDILSSSTRPLSTWVDRTVDMLSPAVRMRFYRIKEYE